MSQPLSCPVMSPTSEQTLPAPDAGRPVERVLVVHAHPDDETIVTGATLATLVDAGARVTVVTCTRGELGEVIPDDLASLRADPAALAVHREGEIAQAMRALGITDHRFLGSLGARTAGLPERAYVDSGMEWGPDGSPVPVADLHPAAFCSAEFGEIVSDLAAVVADTRPDAIVSYDSDGGYGHPDHVRVNRVALQTARLAGVPFFAIARGSAHPEAHRAPGDVVIDGTPVLARKVEALEAYRSQITVVSTPGGPALEYPHGAVEPVTVVETFRYVPVPAVDEGPAAVDLRDATPTSRVVVGLLAVAVGGLFGAIGTVSHQITAGAVPVGIVLSLALVLAALLGARLVIDTRWVACLLAAGLYAVIVLLLGTGAGGSALIPANPAGYAWTFGPGVIGLLVIAWPRIRRDQSGKMVTSTQDAQVLPDTKEQTSP
jgi:N-acetyl-1-D-myo-inositol-2-amino-2-deoxy-alpha-D-glucopyranoside deacetylase